MPSRVNRHSELANRHSELVEESLVTPKLGLRIGGMRVGTRDPSTPPAGSGRDDGKGGGLRSG